MRRNSIILFFVFLIFIACTNTKDAKSDNIAKPHNTVNDKLQTVTDKVQKDELNGFRNIQWGTDISQLNEFQLIRKGKVTMEVMIDAVINDKWTLREKYSFTVIKAGLPLQADGIWIKNKDNLFLGNIKVDNIYYYTVNSRLVGVLLTLDSYEYFSTLKSALTKKYGAERDISDAAEQKTETAFSWKRSNTYITLIKQTTKSNNDSPLTIIFFDAIHSGTALKELKKDIDDNITKRKKKEDQNVDNITKDF